MKSDLQYWTEYARKAEAELKAASGRTALNAAAKKLDTSKNLGERGVI